MRCRMGRVLFVEALSADDPERGLVFYKPCGTKLCPACWPSYVRNVVQNTLVSLRAETGVRSNFSGLIPLGIEKFDHGGWGALRQRLNRAGRCWLSIPLQDGRRAVLAWPCSDEAIPVLEAGPTIEYFLSLHDRSQQVTSSYGVNAAAKPAPKWKLSGITDEDIERVAKILDEEGLTYEWEGIDSIRITEATKEQIQKVVGRLAG